MEVGPQAFFELTVVVFEKALVLIVSIVINLKLDFDKRRLFKP